MKEEFIICCAGYDSCAVTAKGAPLRFLDGPPGGADRPAERPQQLHRRSLRHLHGREARRSFNLRASVRRVGRTMQQRSGNSAAEGPTDTGAALPVCYRF